MRRLSRMTTRGLCSSCSLMVSPRAHRPGYPARWARSRTARSLLVGVLVDDLGVDDVVVAGRSPGGGTGGTRVEAGLAGAVGLRLGVERAADLLRDAGDLLLRGLDRGDVGPTEGGAQLGQGLAQLLLLVGRDLVAVLGQELLRLVLQRLGQVAGLRLLAAALVLLGVGLGVAHHPLDVVLGQGR